jgi:hypothetical protein
MVFRTGVYVFKIMTQHESNHEAIASSADTRCRNGPINTCGVSE